MQGKIIVVSGASSGIGAATAQAVAARGAHAVLLARDETRLQAVAAAIRRAGGGASVFRADLAGPEATARACERILGEIGVPDAIVNSAGAGRWASLLDTSPEEARAMIEAPYLAAFYLTRALLPAMVARGSGHVACVSSPASFLAWPNACAYIAARHALKGFTDALRQDMRGTGVTVTLVVLGTVDSPYWKHNPGSRAHLPKPPRWLAPVLSVEEAAAAILRGLESGSRLVVAPRFFRPLMLLAALMPRLVEARLRRAAKKA